MRRRLEAALAFACALGAVLLLAAPGPAQDAGGGRTVSEPSQPSPGLVAEGRRLFLEGCSSCHGEDARGLPDRAPTLVGVGAAAADFYLRTGRMPLPDPQQQPRRTESFYDEREIDALVSYVAGLGGPPIPAVDPASGDLAHGFELFGEMCAGCHQIVGRGGMTTRAWVPDLQQSAPIDVAEAVAVGPYVMPVFTGQLTRHDVDSLARYVAYAKDPDDVGGWGIGHIGPIPEGMVTWLLAGTALVLTIRLIGERTTE
ncbi:MAG TPA: c-type cytochrome [Capillimicrobium sp.]|nr:c-type cytochrome [Capillimicrobium sp.]